GLGYGTRVTPPLPPKRVRNGIPDSPAEPTTMPCIAPMKEIIRGRLRASGTSLATPSFASEPELAKLTFLGASPGTSCTSRSARSRKLGCGLLTADQKERRR